MAELSIKASFPKKAEFLFQPWRYKILRGGRSSSKSWNAARALLIQGAMKPLRILCAREVQNSIKQSVHQVLRDQIVLLGLEDFYRVTDNDITGKNGTLFSFTGLSNLTVDTIKSFEGYDIAWVEEGQVISDRSWKILTPTIRKDGSEIWVTYNPDLESDPTHMRFTINPPKDCCNVLMNWRDNPWFNEVMEAERLLCKEQFPDDYDNIWEGKCRPAVEGAVYYKQVELAEEQGRICDVPYDPLLKVHLFFDLGWADSTTIGMVQRKTSELRFIDYISGSQRPLDDYSRELREKGYNWGKVFLPHDGFSKMLQTGKSSADILSALGWEVIQRGEMAEQSVEEGIRISRLRFGQVYIDRIKCARLLESLKRYRRHIKDKSKEAGNPVHDEFSHGADMFRYACINADNLTNETAVLRAPRFSQGQGAWMM